MAPTNRIVTIVGCGPGSSDYLTRAATQAIEHADVLVGAQRLLDLFPLNRGERLVVTAKLDEVLDSMDERLQSRNIAVLVTGDPGLFSLAKRVIERFGRDRCRVVPGISSVQVAFARLGLDWADARLISAHKEDPALEPGLESAGKIAILCGRKGSLQWIQDNLNHLLSDHRKIFVLENLTLENERIREVRSGNLAAVEAAPSTIVIIVRESLIS
jgi:cobalt-precorrin-7 (C5)-methyltransferase